MSGEAASERIARLGQTGELAIASRRQCAREAYHDNGGAPDARGEFAPVEVAIEVATRVQVTPDLVTVMLHEVDRLGVQNGGIEAGLAAAFRAAGFEVME